MTWTADIIVFAVIALFGLVGFAKGFFKSIVGFFSFLISVAAAVLLAGYVTKLLLSVDPIGKWIAGDKGSLFSFIKGFMPAGLNDISIAKIQAHQPNPESLFSDFSWFFVKICYPIVKNGVTSAAYLSSGMATAADIFALEMAFGIASFIVGIALFIVIRIIVKLLSLILTMRVDQDAKKNFFGRFGGMVLGFAKGLVLSMIVLSVLTLMSNLSFMGDINKALDEAPVSRHLVTISATVSGKMIGLKPDEERCEMLLELAGLTTPVYAE